MDDGNWLTLQDAHTGEWIAAGREIRAVMELPTWNIGNANPWMSCHPDDRAVMWEFDTKLRLAAATKMVCPAAHTRFRAVALKTGRVFGLDGVSYRLLTKHGARFVTSWQVVPPLVATQRQQEWVRPITLPCDLRAELGALAASRGIAVDHDELATLALRTLADLA
jgi:hypothetical protein